VASLGVNERLVKLVRVDQSIAPAISGAAIDAGVTVVQDTTGRYVAGAGNATRGIVVETVLTANAPISVLKKGILDLGGTILAAKNPGDSVYATAAGVLDDSATSNTLVGTVVAGRGDLDGDGVNRKYLKVDL
jgi:hypothetical protein